MVKCWTVWLHDRMKGFKSVLLVIAFYTFLKYNVNKITSEKTYHQLWLYKKSCRPPPHKQTLLHRRGLHSLFSRCTDSHDEKSHIFPECTAFEVFIDNSAEHCSRQIYGIICCSCLKNTLISFKHTVATLQISNQ